MEKLKLSDPLLKPLTDDQLALLSRRQLVLLLKSEQSIRLQLEEKAQSLAEEIVMIEGVVCRLKKIIFGSGSEKSEGGHKPHSTKPSNGGGGKGKKPRGGTLSQRYANAEVEEIHVELNDPPPCKCCGKTLVDSGLTEESEQLSRRPAEFYIKKIVRHIYKCGSCHEGLVTTPTPPRVLPGSLYSDELVIDVTLAKFLDLIPIQRYCAMATREGFEALPPQSLIDLTIRFASFLKPVIEMIRAEVLKAPVLWADETPHRMLEGDPRANWYLWGFFSELSALYECHDTRSGDVASNILIDAECTVLVSDVYSGYQKAARVTNELRAQQDKPLIELAYCNAHARRYFKNAEPYAPDSVKKALGLYRAIYGLEAEAKGKGEACILAARALMTPHFEGLKKLSESILQEYSAKSLIAKGAQYFTNHYQNLTRFIKDPRISIDNNHSERLLRSPVVGRKTWYGTHSVRGAEATAVHFSIIQSCKLNNVNPRRYYPWVVSSLLRNTPLKTPREYAIAGLKNDSA